jgi:hypothetical protein
LPRHFTHSFASWILLIPHGFDFAMQPHLLVICPLSTKGPAFHTQLSPPMKAERRVYINEEYICNRITMPSVHFVAIAHYAKAACKKVKCLGLH